MNSKRNESWNVSFLNFEPEVRLSLELPQKVVLYDVTLRDGEQTPGVVLTKQERVRIAQALSDIGVQRIEGGFPIVSQEDRDALVEIAHAGLESEVWGFGRCLPKDVELNAECGVERVLLEISISDFKLAAYGLDRRTVERRMLDALTRAKELGLKTAFMPVDLTRTELPFAEKIIRLAAEKGHADEIVIVDTIGVTTPEAISFLTSRIRAWTDVPLAIHCHNDFGLALANSIAALKSGAHCVHTSVNCLGERAGNVDLAEVVMALHLLYGIKTGIRTEALSGLAWMVEEISGHMISETKPIVGRKLFTRESGGVVQQLVTLPAAVEPFEPSLVGLSREVVLGKKSGRHSIVHKLELLGLSATDAEIDALLTEVKRLSIAQKSLITDEQFQTALSNLRANAREVLSQ